MKQFLILFIVVLFMSCKGKNDYKMTIYYMKMNSTGMMILVHDSKDITAENDSLAYREASKQFRYIKDTNKNKNRIPKNFELFDYKAKEVIDINYIISDYN